VTLPKEKLREHGLTSDDEVLLRETDDGDMLVVLPSGE
jgi:hypothetical protein